MNEHSWAHKYWIPGYNCNIHSFLLYDLRVEPMILLCYRIWVSFVVHRSEGQCWSLPGDSGGPCSSGCLYSFWLPSCSSASSHSFKRWAKPSNSCFRPFPTATAAEHNVHPALNGRAPEGGSNPEEWQPRSLQKHKTTTSPSQQVICFYAFIKYTFIEHDFIKHAFIN